MTNIDEIKSVYSDMLKLKEFHKKHPTRIEEYLQISKTREIDKYGFGFCRDDRFSAVGKHSVSFDSWKGYFGSSDCTRLLVVGNPELFWRAFDKYLNQHQEEILQYIASEFKRELDKRRTEINDAISSLIKLKKTIDGEEGGIDE